MPFQDRNEAARRLAERLAPYRGRHPLVLAVPRGGVPMAALVADALGGELDVVLVHKLGAPGNPEFAVGAVDEAGTVHRSDHPAAARIAPAVLQEEARRRLQTLRARRARYTPVRPPIDPAGRVVIVVDDGIATGATLLAALAALRRRRPEELVAAVGVAPPDTLERVRAVADTVVCLETPSDFMAVGQFFDRFEQVSDDEVVALLRAHSTPGP